ncbi:MAG: DUF1822 family protein [Kovacikia sp.]
MTNQAMSATYLRLLLPETLWLEPEHFEQAREISQPFNNEQQQWQAYLNALARLAFAAWLTERLPEQAIQQPSSPIVDVSYLQIDQFKLCLVATEQVLDEVVNIPKITLEKPDLVAHFYVVLEVLEDQEEVIIRGFLRYDELIAQANQITSFLSDELCRIPLSAFDAELNHLIVYLQYAEPSAIPLPVISAKTVDASSPKDFSILKTQLSRWLQGVLDEGWQTLDTLINPEANLAWSTRHTPSSAKGGKLINLGMQLGSQPVVLLVTVIPESEGKIGVNIQVLPAAGAQFLPSQLQLTLLSSTDRILQEVQSRNHDNLIQLKPFKGRPGNGFSVEVRLNDIRVKEVFEL